MMRILPSLSVTLIGLLLLAWSTEAYRYENVSGGGVGQQHNLESFFDANENPTHSHNVSFPGWNFNADPTTSSSDSGSDWIWQVRQSTVQVDDATPAAPEGQNWNVTNTVSTIYFPNDGSAPLANDTVFQLCVSALSMPFPKNITDRSAAESGNCSVTLGESCYNAYLAAWQHTGRTSGGCAQPPYWQGIPECVAEIGSLDSGIITFSLMNETDSAVTFNTSSPTGYSNITSGEAVDPEFHGLQSGQPFYFTSTEQYNNATEAGAERLKSEQVGMRMMVLSFGLTNDYLNSQGGIADSQIRLMCQPVDSSLLRNAASDGENTAPLLKTGMGPMSAIVAIAVAILLI